MEKTLILNLVGAILLSCVGARVNAWINDSPKYSTWYGMLIFCRSFLSVVAGTIWIAVSVACGIYFLALR